MPKTYEATMPWRWLAQGIPFTGDARHAPVAILTGEVAPGLDDESLRNLLHGGLIVDDGALTELWKRGLGEHTGVRPNSYHHACFEVYTEHPLNTGKPGDGRSPMWWGGLGFEPLNDEVEVLSRLARFDGGQDFGACTTIYRNSLGGRVVNLGLDPWIHIGLHHKMGQFHNLVDWAAEGALPLRVPTARISPFLRIAPDRSRFVLMLLNTSFDDLEDLEIHLNSSATQVRELATAHPRNCRFHFSPEGQITLQVPRITAWSHRVFAGNLE
jgi:hypothetical protein